ncbi:MAG: ComF family protein [Alphaproteobacteria bacterium]|nr:MAG: ComF family protein [Alphaproteobacteria bacterium]
MKKTLLDAAFPPGCASCAEPIDIPGTLCANCWQDLTYITPPFCEACGYPFEYAEPGVILCGVCVKRAPSFTRARAVLKYDDASRDMILGYKHSDQTDRAPAFASWMLRAGRELVEECDIICPVPLHRRRLVARRFNQSALLALEIGRLAKRAVCPDMLLRIKPTRSQGGLSARARFRNVKGVFKANPLRLSQIEDQRILLIDDVYTTGATLEACSDCLLRTGAADVDVLTFSRVVRGSDLSI